MNSTENNSQHYYTENPTSKIIEKHFEYRRLSFTSVSGVFGFSPYVDKASQLLIDSFVPSDPNGSILDLGCGFGAIGLSLKQEFPACEVVMTDINTRAAEYSRLNARANHLEVSVLSGNLYEPVCDMPQHFSDIVTNPPIAVGKAFNTQLIEDSVRFLRPGGSLWLVAFHNKGGSTLRKIMSDIFGNVTDIAKGGGIRVYRSSLDK